MRIYNINSYYFSSSVHKTLEDSLLREGHNLTTFVPLEKNYNIREECNFEIPAYVNAVECYNRYDRIFFQLKQFKIIRKLFEVLGDSPINYDLIHAHSLFTNGLIAYQLMKRFKIPYIVTLRDTDLNVFFKKMPHLRGVGIDIMKNSDKVIFLSQSYRDQCIRKYVPLSQRQNIYNKSTVIPSGIDKYWIENINYNNEKNNNSIELLYVGNIINRKNLIRVLQASELIRSEGYKIHFTIVGKVVNKRVAKKLLSSNLVTYSNRVNKEELIKYYRKSDIFVMPSLTETFGLVYPEAMSQGLPVLYSRNQGFDGYFSEGEVGYSVDPLNVEDIKNKILQTYNSYNEISNRCIDNVYKFSWDTIIKKYNDLYKDVNNDFRKEKITFS